METEEKQTRKRERTTDLNAAAQLLLDVLYGMDAGWKDRDEACADEYGLSPAQRMLKYAAMVLDQGLHLNLLAGYDFVEPGATRDGELLTPMRGVCPECHKSFDRKVPGQVCCSNECGTKHFPPPQLKTPEYSDVFEAEMDKLAAGVLNGPADPRPAALPTGGTIR